MPALKNKVALVTGASTGIGFAVAQRFIDGGAQVHLTGRRELQVAAESLGPRAHAVRTDVSQPQETDRLAQTIDERHGRLDVLVVNAGGGSRVPLGQITAQQYGDVFATNVAGALYTV